MENKTHLKYCINCDSVCFLTVSGRYLTSFISEKYIIQFWDDNSFEVHLKDQLDNQCVLKLNFLPDITPSNVKEKLPIYLLLK